MPQNVFIDGVGDVEFDDNLSPGDIQGIIERDILPSREAKDPMLDPANFQSESPKTDNLFGRFMASTAENSLMAAQGLLRMTEHIPGQEGLNWVGSKINEALSKRIGAPVEINPRADLTDVLNLAQTRARGDWGVTTPADTLPEKIAEGVGSLPPVVASGPVSPATNFFLMSEQQRQEAVDSGASDNVANLSGLMAGTVGLASEKLLGIPAMLKGGGGTRLLDTALLGFAREGTQEAGEQLAQNAIAKAMYDPQRDMTEGVKESAMIGGIIGAPLNLGMQGEREGAAVSDKPDYETTDKAFSDAPERDLSGYGSQAREQAPSQVEAAPPVPTEVAPEQPAEVAPSAPTPDQQVSAQVLGQDPTELQQQAAVVNGQPAPVIDRQGPDPIEPDTYERLADEPVREGWQAYQDPETLQVFQVPEGSTAEVIQNRLTEVRQEESLAYTKEREAQLERELMQQRFDENVKKFLAEQEAQKEAPIVRKDLTADTPPQEIWSDVDRLKFILDRQETNLKRAQAGTLKESDGTPVKPESLEKGVEELRQRYDELKSKVVDAREAFKGMKRGSSEKGSTEIPQAIVDLGTAVYRKGTEFAAWSKAMLKSLGSRVQPFLKQIWDGITSSVNSLSPAGRRFKQSGSAGGVNPEPKVSEDMAGLYEVTADTIQRSTTDQPAKSDLGEAERQAVREAYQQLVQETGRPSQRIADVMERAGLDLGNQSKGLLMQMYQNGEIVSLTEGDWSLSSNRTKAWAVRNQGQSATLMRMDPESMQRSAPSPEGGAVGGQGGRRPPSTPETPPPLPSQPKTMGVLNANVDQARKSMGLPPAMEPARIKLGDIWNQAMAIMEGDPMAAQKLVLNLETNPRSLTPVETAMLVHERIRLDTEYNRDVDRVNTSKTDAERQYAQTDLERSRANNQRLFDVTKLVGTKSGQELAARKLLANEDYTLARMEAENRAANGGKPLSPEQLQQIKTLHDELAKAKAKMAEMEEKLSQQSALETFRQLIADMKSDAKQAKKEGRTVTEFLNQKADEARIRLRKKMSTQLGSTVDPTIIVDLAIIGSSHVANGITKLADFTAKMVEEFGAQIEPLIPEVFKQANDFHEANQKVFGKDKPKPTDAAPSEVAPEAPATSAELAAKATEQLDPKLVFQLARAFVNEGVTGMENVMKAVHAALAPKIPGLEIRDVRDAFSGYGKMTYPSKADDLVKLREYKVLARLTSQLEDVQRRMAPLKTGPQRDKMTAEARILQKQISDLMRKYDIRTTSPEQQLATAIQAVKSRLRNQIEELNAALQKNERLPQNQRTIEYDAEAKALREQRDRLKERYDQIFQRPEKTAEERVKARLKALDNALAEESQMLREGILRRPKAQQGVSSPEIENKQMELDAMRQLRRDLYAATQPRKAPEDIALESALKVAKKSIDRMDQMLKSGNLSPEQRAKKFNPTNELESLWSERDAMRDALNELRRAQKPRTDPEEAARKRAVAALEKSIKKLDDRIARNDFSTTPKKATRPETQRVAELREIRDTMRQTFNELKKAQTPSRSPEEIALGRDKKNIANRIKKLQEKIAAGDYAPAPKKPPITDADKQRLQYDYAKLRETYLKGVYDLQLKNQGPVKKVIRTGAEILNTSRAILTSLDVSGVLRQGGFIAFAHPVRAAKNLPAMFRAFASERAYHSVMEDIRNRKNFPLYNQAKLYLADEAPASLSKMEENYMSRWANKIPLVAGSQRAYVAFLNKLRADSFDAMAAGLTPGGNPTEAESKAIANFVNVATGRGDMGKLAAAGVALNTAFFAPRYVLSRFQLLAGQPFYGGNARTRKMIAGEYARYLAGVAVFLGLLAAARDDDDPKVETDPRSSDFLKVRYGNTRIDPFSGILQPTVLTSRLLMGSTKTSAGKVIPIRGDKVPFGKGDAWDVTGRFLRTKFNPAVGTAVDLAAGKNVTGEPVTPADAAARMVVPLSFGDVLKAMQENGVPKGTALMMLSLFGVGIQTYSQKPKASKDTSDKLDKL